MNVRTTLLALKLYIVALALGLFVFGWALIARRDAARVRIAAQDPATPQIIVVLPNNAVPPLHIRTRTS